MINFFKLNIKDTILENQYNLKNKKIRIILVYDPKKIYFEINNITDFNDNKTIMLLPIFNFEIKKYNKKNKFYTYAGFIFDHKYEYSIISKDYCIILAEIDNNEKVNYSMECVKEFDKIPTIKIFSKEV